MAVADGGYPLPPALREQPRHPLLEKGTFEQLHRNDIIETKPHVLHFGGFQIHKEHSHVVRIVNISPTSLRVSVVGPSTQWFRMGFDKKGLLAPGMSEDITVFFTPHEWRYYYDTIKIHCGDLAENLLVPIHAYPSANDIKLPRVIDFGRVAIGTKKTRAIPLSCKIPIQFEYEITVLESHPDFEVSPLMGAIPADGTTEVVVTFAPTRHRTARAELQFNISQFDFDPVTVSVVGSCAPDLLRDEIISSAQAELEVEEARGRQENMSATVEKLKKKKSRGPLEVKPPTFAVQVAERTIEGVKVPTTRFDQQATNFVLNQTAGKLPLKDLFSFIREQREGLKTLQQEQAGKNPGDGADLEDVATGASEDEDKQALELRFEMHYREVEKYDRGKELKSSVARGEEQPTEEEIKTVHEAREQRHGKLIERRMSADIGRVDSVLHQGKTAIPNSFRPAVAPNWDENANDTFSVRLQVIDRFLRAGAKVLMRLRASRRSQSLRQAMRAAGVVDRTSCRAWVEEETKAAAAGSKGGKAAPSRGAGGAASTSKTLATGAGTGAAAATATGGLAALLEDDAVAEVLATVNIPRDFVLPMCIPTSQPGMSAEERQPVEVTPLDNFEEFLPAPINPRMDFKVLDYQKYSVPPPAAYMRPHPELGRLKGALEEHSVRGPRGVATDGAEEPLAMPDSCLLPPSHDAMSLLVPSTECRTYIPLPEATECDPEYRLAQPPPLLEPLETVPLLPPDIMALDNPWLAAWRPRRQLADPFQHLDPAPACFAEAGGPFGPRLGCDAGGERISFLPVGGLDRDVPSDTDDDECPEFELPPPSDEALEAAQRSLEAPLTSERWRKEREAEDRMKERCASNNQAVRERLIELNKHLSYENKVYLG